MKTIILTQEDYISNEEYYEAGARFESDDEDTLTVIWEILPAHLDDNGEIVEREADDDCDWNAPVYVYDQAVGKNIYDKYNDAVKFSERFVLNNE